MKIIKCAKLGWTERQHSCTNNCPDNKPIHKQYTHKILHDIKQQAPRSAVLLSTLIMIVQKVGLCDIET